MDTVMKNLTLSPLKKNIIYKANTLTKKVKLIPNPKWKQSTKSVSHMHIPALSDVFAFSSRIPSNVFFSVKYLCAIVPEISLMRRTGCERMFVKLLKAYKAARHSIHQTIYIKQIQGLVSSIKLWYPVSNSGLQYQTMVSSIKLLSPVSNYGLQYQTIVSGVKH